MGGVAPQGLGSQRKKAVDPSMRLAATAASSSWPCGGLGGKKGWGWGTARPHLPGPIWFLLCFGLSFSLRQGLTDLGLTV